MGTMTMTAIMTMTMTMTDNDNDSDNDNDNDGGGRQDLGDQQQKHNERQQDGNTHGHFLTGVSRQVEDADAEKRDKDARNDEVDCVEQSLTTQLKRKRNLCLVVTFLRVVRVV